MSELWQKDLTVANRIGVHKVMDLWHRWQSAGVPDGAALEVAAVLIGMFRYEEALEILKTLGDDLQVQRQRALVLAKSGRVNDAIEILEGLRADGHDDAETLGILAGRYKQRALAAGDDGADLQTAYSIYLEAYEDTKDTYPGINAASLALELEDSDEGARIATEIVEQLVQIPRAEMDHWQFATLGEAYLLLDNLEDATRWYRKAVAANPNAIENIATMRRQARRNLENLKQTVDALDKVLTVRGVVVFTGHMVDRPGRAEPRFPQGRVGDVRLAVREKLKAHGAGFGVSSAAAGSDLLFLEEMLERGGHAEVILPFPEADFIETSVHEWEDRFHKVLEDPRVSVTILADGRPPDEELEVAFQACNARLLDRAKEIGKSLDEEPVLLAVWDGKPGDGVGGTAGAVGEWRNAGFTVDVIALGGPGQPQKGEQAGTDPAAKDPTRGVKVATPHGGKRKRKKGLYANRFCLAIGIQDYHGEMWPPLGNTLNDAEAVSQVLEGMYDFDARILRNEKATKANIAEAIEDTLGNEVGEDDLVVLFFAGHGHTIHKKGQEHGFIVPFDANEEQTSKLIRMDALVSWSTYLECRHILYVFDSCFSGILSLGAGGVRVAQDPQAAAIAIAAGTAEQPVLDGGGDGHSIFTHNLLQALEGVDDGETITATELYSYVRKRVKQFTTEQSPTLGQMPNHQGGEIELERFA